MLDGSSPDLHGGFVLKGKDYIVLKGKDYMLIYMTDLRERIDLMFGDVLNIFILCST